MLWTISVLSLQPRVDHTNLVSLLHHNTLLHNMHYFNQVLLIQASLTPTLTQ
jgi:hypothetical protein